MRVARDEFIPLRVKGEGLGAGAQVSVNGVPRLPDWWVGSMQRSESRT